MEGVGNQDIVDSFIKTFSHAGGVRANPLADGRISSLNFSFRQLYHVRIEIECRNASVDQRSEWAGEVTVTAAKVEHAHGGSDPDLPKQCVRIWPQHGPPIPVRHGRTLKQCRHQPAPLERLFGMTPTILPMAPDQGRPCRERIMRSRRVSCRGQASSRSRRARALRSAGVS